MSTYPVVTLSARVRVEDRHPEVLTNRDYPHRDKPFAAVEYVAVPHTYASREVGWTWQRTGPVLRGDGQPYADGSTGLQEVPVTDVPAYARRALADELQRRETETVALIRRWAAAAEATAEGVTA